MNHIVCKNKKKGGWDVILSEFIFVEEAVADSHSEFICFNPDGRNKNIYRGSSCGQTFRVYWF